jgi:cytochrome c oxidase assembly factor 3, fungi type
MRAREPYRVKNMVTGLAISSFAVGVWLYSIRVVKQDNFDDVDEEARAMARAGVKDVDVKDDKDGSIMTTVSGEAQVKAVGLLAGLEKRFPRAFDPKRKTIVWGAPPVDSIGREGGEEVTSSR